MSRCVWSAIRKSYKKECQEKDLLHRLKAAACLGIRPPHCLSVRSSLKARVILFCLRVRSAWSYSRLVAYGFIRLSEEA
jgi:hypothetical protein